MRVVVFVVCGFCYSKRISFFFQVNISFIDPCVCILCVIHSIVFYLQGK